MIPRIALGRSALYKVYLRGKVGSVNTNILLKNSLKAFNGKVELNWHITHSNSMVMHSAFPISQTCTVFCKVHTAAVEGGEW